MSSPTLPNANSSLLVPIHLNAWVIDPSAAKNVPNWFTADYSKLENFESPIPAAFERGGEGEKPEAGIHLHWTLPDALTRGHQKDPTHPVEFPYAPNRWLILRFNSAQKQWVCKAWVVKSDHLAVDDDDDAKPGKSAFLDPHKATTTDDVYTATIGRSHTIEAWESDADRGTDSLFLTAVSPGNVAFGGYMPFARDVFSFVDSDLPDEGTGVHAYSYMVVGWFSDPETADPLRGVKQYDSRVWPQKSAWQQQSEDERLVKLLTDLRWSVKPHNDTTPWRQQAPSQRLQTVQETLKTDATPATSLYHSFVYDVSWPSGLSPHDGASRVKPENLHVAVGNTGADALAALIQATHKESSVEELLAHLLQAAQHDLLPIYDEPGGQARIEQAIRHEWFGSAPGGIVWEAVGQTPETADQDPIKAKLNDAQQAALNKQFAQLNKAQLKVDAEMRELAALQTDLYMLWWKDGKANSGGGGWGDGYDPGTLYPKDKTMQWDDLSDKLDSELLPDLKKNVATKLSDVASQQKQLPDPTDPAKALAWANQHIKLPQSSGSGTTTLKEMGLTLKASTRPNFYHPNDPVVLIANVERSQRHGEDGRENKDDSLTCRVARQTVTGVGVNGTNITAAMMQTAGIKLDPLSSHHHIPDVGPLLEEAFFVDPANAGLMEAASHQKEAQIKNELEKQQGWIETVRPSSFAIQPWEQPWSPLFMEWRASYYPTAHFPADSHEGPDKHFQLSDWTFDGETYQWAGGGYDLNYNHSYQGRAIVMPHVSLTFKKKIAAYLKNHAHLDSQQLEELLQTISNWDIVATSLSGFTQNLLTLTDEATFPPPADDKIGKLIGEQYHAAPILLPTEDQRFGKGFNHFWPIRAGFLHFADLQLVDAFNQTVQLNHANTQQGFLPTFGQGMKPNDPQHSLPYGAVSLSPRVIQPSRLDLQLLAADTVDEEGRGTFFRTAVNPNPICGWLLPNHLDGGIGVYDSSGLPLGELLPLPAPDNWRPRPGAPGHRPPPATPAAIHNPVLRQVVQSLAARSTAEFDDILQAIDATMWMVDPLGGRKDEMLSVLVGRPLAVVAAEIQLMLDGPPLKNRFWSKMLTPKGSPIDDIGNIKEIKFPVRLGSLELRNDGLLGYFSPDYDQFNAVHMPPELAKSDHYVQEIGHNNNYLHLSYSAEPQPLTLLLDPRGVVHASSGILPTTSTRLPAYTVEQFLKQLSVSFRSGPIITEPDTLRLPIPSENNGTWRWVQRNAPAVWAPARPIVKANDRARMADDQLQLREGWLLFDRSDGANASLFAPPPLVDAALYVDQKRLYLFTGSDYTRYNSGESGYSSYSGYPAATLRGWGGTFPHIDAAFYAAGDAYFFAGNQSVRFGNPSNSNADESPHPINQTTWPGLPFGQLTAAFAVSLSEIYLFNGNAFCIYDLSDKRLVQERRSVDERSWPGLPFSWIDAAFIGEKSEVTFFSGTQFAVYDLKAKRLIDGGKRSITKSQWPSLPEAARSSI
ncbi:MAG: hypothetical protein AAF614_14580 [Chloroflexota bacterium]